MLIDEQSMKNDLLVPSLHFVIEHEKYLDSLNVVSDEQSSEDQMDCEQCERVEEFEEDDDDDENDDLMWRSAWSEVYDDHQSKVDEVHEDNNLYHPNPSDVLD